MVIKNPKGFWEIKEFKNFPDLIHGISSRKFGDCRKNFKIFLNTVGLKKENLVLAEQVHKDKIKVVGSQNRGQKIPGVDGLLTQEIGIVLGIRTGDCLPIFYFEPEAKIIGLAHAGWRGVLSRLPQKMVDQIIRLGGLPENVLVGIGPHICQKCYQVEERRVESFFSEFGKLKGMIKNNFWLDLFLPTKIQLIHSGVLEKNIFPSGICNACQNEEFFSYRKDSPKTYGEMLSVISLSK